MGQEIFKPIKGYEQYYEVSNFGRVKSLAKTWSVGIKGDTFLKPGERRTGYSFVVLCVDRVKKYASVHRLVAEHFCDNPNNNNVVNHLDSNTKNNSYDNLEWTTYSGNAIHAFNAGRRNGRKGEKHHNSQITEKEVKEIKELYKKGTLSQSQIGRIFFISQTQIGRIVRNERWKHI